VKAFSLREDVRPLYSVENIPSSDHCKPMTMTAREAKKDQLNEAYSTLLLFRCFLTAGAGTPAHPGVPTKTTWHKQGQAFELPAPTASLQHSTRRRACFRTQLSFSSVFLSAQQQRCYRQACWYDEFHTGKASLRFYINFARLS